jgi:putative DNA primase/helicase
MALNPVFVPLIITKDQKQQLLDLGYKKAQINKMTPEEAHKILGIEPEASDPIFAGNTVDIPEKFQPPVNLIEIPSNPEAEKSLIGGLLFNQSKELWESVTTQIVPGHFHLESHQKIYQGMVNLFERGELPNLVTVIDELKKLKQLKRVGGEAYIAGLIVDQYRRESLAGEIRLIRSTYQARYLLSFTQRVQKRIFAGSEDGHEILDSIRSELGALNGHAKHRIQSICAATIKPTKVKWLWERRLPLRAYSLMQGIEGIGKSTLLCEVAAAITTGKQIPDFSFPERGKVLWLAAEDDSSEDLIPRLMAAGANLDMVQIIDQGFSLLNPKGMLNLKSEIEQHQPLLVILDPLFAFTEGRENDGEVARTVTNEFKIFSGEFCCSILGVRHVNKSKGFGDPRAAGSGHVGWQAAARSVLMVGYDPDNPTHCAIMPTKGNKADWRNAPVLGYEIRSDITSPSGAHFFWTGNSNLTAKRILETSSDDEDMVERKHSRSRIEEFLEDVLSSGPVLITRVKEMAGDAGLSVSYLVKLCTILNIKVSRKWESGKQFFYWSLPEGYKTNGQPKLNFDEKTSESDSDNRKTVSESLSLLNGTITPDFGSDSDNILVHPPTVSDNIRVTPKNRSKTKKRKEKVTRIPHDDLSESLLPKNEAKNSKTYCSKCGAKLEENGQCDYCSQT